MTERHLRLFVAVLAAAAVAVPANASFYRWIDAAGTLIYSDSPPRGVAPAVPAQGSGAVSAATEAVVPASAQPPNAPAVAAVTIDQVIALTGLDRRFKQVSALLVDQFERELSHLRAEDRATAMRAVTPALAADAIRQAVRAELAAQSHPAHMAALAEWHRSPIGKRRAAASAVLATPAGGKALAAFAERLRTVPPTPLRLALIEQLDWTEATTDDTLAVRSASARAMRLTTNSLLPLPRRQRVSAIDRDLDIMRAELHADVQDEVTTMLLFVSRELSDAELEQTIVFHGSAPARWFDAAVRQAVLRTARAAAERGTRDVVQAVPLDRWYAPVAVAAKTR